MCSTQRANVFSKLTRSSGPHIFFLKSTKASFTALLVIHSMKALRFACFLSLAGFFYRENTKLNNIDTITINLYHLSFFVEIISGLQISSRLYQKWGVAFEDIFWDSALCVHEITPAVCLAKMNNCRHRIIGIINSLFVRRDTNTI